MPCVCVCVCICEGLSDGRGVFWGGGCAASAASSLIVH